MSEVDDLRKEVGALRDMVRRLEEMTTIENVLEQGFEKVASYLEPLRDIRPQRILLKEAETRNLRNIQTSLARPDWGDVRQKAADGEYSDGQPPMIQTVQRGRKG